MEDLTKRLIDLQTEQAKVNSALLKYLESGDTTKAPNPSELLEEFVQKQANSGVWEVGIPRVPNNVAIEIGNKSTVSPKLDFAIQWLKAHPEDKGKSGRDLEASVLMDGETISYKWWNKAKSV